MFRTITQALALALVGLSLPLCAERVQDLPRPTNYVSDFAGVLTPETQQRLNALCAAVDQQAHAQIAVVTIHSLDGLPIENFATQLEDAWKVGRKGTDRGILLIVAVNDHKYRFEVGYGLEGILPDGKVGDIGRSMVPYLRQNNYDRAIAGAVLQVSQVIAADAGVTLQVAPQRGPPPQAQPQAQPLTLGQLILMAAGLFVVIILLARFGGSGLIWFLVGMFFGGGRGGRGGGGWGGGGGGGDGGGFGGFGGGSSGGGGASGSW